MCFALVGVANTGVDIGLFALFTGVFGFQALVVNPFSYGAGILTSYVLNAAFTFRKKLSVKALLRFVAVCLVVFGINQLVLFVCKGLMGDLLAKLTATAVCLCVNFVASRLLVFKNEER